MEYINSLNWRYATKKFNATRKLEEDVLNRILQAGNLSASSLGLQPIKVVNVTQTELREQLKTKSYNQSQVTDASNLLVICVETELDEVPVKKYMQRISDARKVDLEALAGFETTVRNFVKGLPSEEAKLNWLAKQAYIVLGTLLTACALEKVDSCPMEGFQPEGYAEVLDLKSKGLYPVLALPIGYRAVDDKNQHFKKVRKSMEEYVIHI